MWHGRLTDLIIYYYTYNEIKEYLQHSTIFFLFEKLFNPSFYDVTNLLHIQKRDTTSIIYACRNL